MLSTNMNSAAGTIFDQQSFICNEVTHGTVFVIWQCIAFMFFWRSLIHASEMVSVDPDCNNNASASRVCIIHLFYPATLLVETTPLHSGNGITHWMENSNWLITRLLLWWSQVYSLYHLRFYH